MMTWLLSKILSFLVLLTSIGLLANVVVKYWQRVTRDVGDLQVNPAWSFLETQLRNLAYKVDSVERREEKRSSSVTLLYKWMHMFTIQALNFERYMEKANAIEPEREIPLRRIVIQHVGFISLAVAEVLVCFILKIGLSLYALAQFLLSAEMQGFDEAVNRYWEPYLDKSGQFVSDGKEEKRLRIVFIRHGESMWNRAFNRGYNWRSICRIAIVSFWELSLLGDLDSVIFDSPLSSTGVAQAAELQSWFTVEQHSTVNPNVSTNTKSDNAAFTKVMDHLQSRAGVRVLFIASNLRRAISTLGIAVNQLMMPEDQVLITSHLQETTRNPDAISLTSPGTHCLPSVFEIEGLPWNIKWFYENKVDWQDNDGNRKLNARLADRHKALVEFLDRVSNKHGFNDFVVCGHSLWLKCFFRHYLPPCVDHQCKHRKVSNCGIILFDLIKERRSDGSFFYRIDSDSIDLCRGIYL